MAQGYTRQSTANIVNGAVIDALYLNNEFNQIEAAMNAVSGHTHDGTSGQGGILNLTNMSGVLSVSGGGTGVSAGAFTTSGQMLISPAAGQLSVYTIGPGLKISGSKFEVNLSAGTGMTISGGAISHALTGSGAIVLSGAQFTLGVSAPLVVSGSKLELYMTSALKISGGKLDLTSTGGGASVGLIYFIGG